MCHGENASAVVISPAWPSIDNGSGFAVLSLLQQCIRVFDKIQLIVLADSCPRATVHIHDKVCYTHIRTRRFPKSVRFVLSLGSSLPASCYQFRSKGITDQVLVNIHRTVACSSKCVVILEDLPIAISFLDHIRKQFPGIGIAIRSENVLSKIFEPLAKRGNALSRLVWSIEVAKMRQAETAACKNADRVWAISVTDQQEYLRRLGIKCDGVFGISLDGDRFANIPPGDSQTLVFVGGVDLRKRLGLANFFKSAWPKIRTEVPNARLVLAGVGSEKLNDPTRGIYGLGYVADDRAVWAKGQVALNPQELGSGVKLKSIIAMLSARALVSTETGIEGIEGENGTHFLVAPNAEALAPQVIELLKNPARAKHMGQIAKEWARKVYSESRLRQSVLPLLEDFVGVRDWVLNNYASRP